MALIKCDNISLGYEGRTILKDLNFSLNGGEYLCIVGENGAGKSTLIKTILGLKKPMKGTIETGDNLKRTEIGYMPIRRNLSITSALSLRPKKGFIPRLLSLPLMTTSYTLAGKSFLASVCCGI